MNLVKMVNVVNVVNILKTELIFKAFLNLSALNAPNCTKSSISRIGVIQIPYPRTNPYPFVFISNREVEKIFSLGALPFITRKKVI